MTTSHSTPQPIRQPRQHRRLKVRQTYHTYQLHQHRRTPVGEIHLKGHWLIQAGFAINTPVTVNIRNRQLIITAA